MNNCENCYHFHMCDLQYRLEEHQDCKHYKDKSSLIERKALYEKVEELLIGHGYINPDTAIMECLEIIENFPTADVEPERRMANERKTD